jgi:hypothetical protein
MPMLSASVAVNSAFLSRRARWWPDQVHPAERWYTGNTPQMRLFAYECDAAPQCPQCAPGLWHPEDGCRSVACPGMDDSYRTNCSQHGQGENGGCSLRSDGFAECLCVAGYAGAKCEVVNKVRRVHAPAECLTMRLSTRERAVGRPLQVAILIEGPLNSA